ncbi:hypothetical protein TruAng_001712 [Truncatella angustata]|nr:hypothetical protein TruAng_001712 [Truncatella angustata]
MRAIDHLPEYAIGAVPNVYDCASLRCAFIASVGGSREQVAIELAGNFGNVKLLVQDMAMVMEGAESDVPDQLKGCIQFLKYELFDP